MCACCKKVEKAVVLVFAFINFHRISGYSFVHTQHAPFVCEWFGSSRVGIQLLPCHFAGASAAPWTRGVMMCMRMQRALGTLVISEDFGLVFIAAE
jgi:hypothetical protein